MKNHVKFEDLKVRDYLETWEYQETLFQALVNGKREIENQGFGYHDIIINRLLFVEHAHVYTLGKSGSDNNLLLNLNQLKAKGASFYKTNRGGDITYHGPGQIVGYPIFDLECFNLSLKDYIFNLEESIILTLKYFGVTGERLAGSTGVWIDPEVPCKARKICAIGVRASRHVTMHGFAFNVNTDLSYFNYINPCGITDKSVTSLSKEKETIMDLDKVKNLLLRCIKDVFDIEWINP
jgi:lipoyl(octanoyl) transferase